MVKLIAWFYSWGAVLNRATGWPFSRFNRWLYRVSGGRLGAAMPGGRVALLTTSGRRTGRPHTVPVAVWSDGPDFVVGVMSMQAHWLRNLRATPDAQLQLKRDTFSVVAEIIPSAELDAVRRSLATSHPAFDVYARRAASDAPMIRLVTR